MNRHITIEQRIIAAGQGQGTNSGFIRATMDALRATSSNNIFEQQLQGRRRTWQPWPRKLRQLHRTSLAVIAASSLLFVSGSAFAAYSLWLSPSAQLRAVRTEYGHSQALVDLKNCSTNNQKETIEIANGSNGTPAQAAQAAAAHCEIQAIQSWAMQTFHVQPSNIEFAFTVNKVSAASVTIQDATTHTVRSIAFTKGMPIVYKGTIIPSNSLALADAVAVITSPNNKSTVALVKLSYPATLYTSSQIQQAYYDRHPCIGNSGDSCADLPSVDVADFGEGGVNPDTNGKPYQIQGKLVDYTTSTITLEGTSGKHYTIHTTSDLISSFNTNNIYGMTIDPGDVLTVLYTSNGSPEDIQSTQYHMIQLMLQSATKQPPTNAQKYHY